MSEHKIQTSLPENAYRELKPGESYVPMVPGSVTVPEVTLRSILFGLLMCVLFSMAASYLALKVGQGIETAIPISVLALGLSGVLVRAGMRKSSLIENVNVLAISTTSGIVAGGSVFTMPAVYLLNLDEKLGLSKTALFLQISLVPLLGAILGVIFLVPFRRYFVKEMHGKLPFPEGTATNEILVTGESGGKNAFVLIYSFLISGVYAFMAGAMKWWPENFTTGTLAHEFKERVTDASGQVANVAREFSTLAFSGELGTRLAEKLKVIFFLGTGAEYVGLGIIIGLRYASIICAGSFLSWFVIVPLLGPLDRAALSNINPTLAFTPPADNPQAAPPPVAAGELFSRVPRNIGIGCIFAAGILSILKMSRVIVTALREALGGLFKGGATHKSIDRTDQDISYPVLMVIGVATAIVIGLYFRLVVLKGMPDPNWLAFVATLLALGVSFIFTTVSAWAIATISVTPISGMTVTTIIITAICLIAAGLPRGDRAMLAVLLVGGVVATSLSMAGTLVTEFKIGYWTGATPKSIQWSALAAAAVAAVVVTFTITILADNPGFDQEADSAALAAPQATLMKSALQSFLGASGQVPWLLYGIGVAVAISLQLINVSPLAFGLGIYLPMELNTPILVGAIVAAIVPWGSKDERHRKARNDKAILIASGLIAGAAITGVAVKWLQAWGKTEAFMEGLDRYRGLLSGSPPPARVDEVLRNGNWIGLVAFLLICLFVWIDSRRAKPSTESRNVVIPGH